jgi:hypothetical protein
MEPTSSEYKQLKTNDFELSESGLNVERKVSLNPNPVEPSLGDLVDKEQL